MTEQETEIILAEFRENAKLIDDQSLEQFEKEWEDVVTDMVNWTWEQEEKKVKMSAFKRFFLYPYGRIHTKEEINKMTRSHLERDGHKKIAHAFFMSGIYYTIATQVENAKAKRESTNEKDKQDKLYHFPNKPKDY